MAKLRSTQAIDTVPQHGSGPGAYGGSDDVDELIEEVRSPMGNRFLRSCLVRPFEGVEVSVGALRAVSVLKLEEVCVRVPGFDTALSAALWHESCLHERRHEVQNLTPGVLRALEVLGGSWITRELATLLARSRHDEKPGTISSSVAEAKLAFPQRLAEREEWVVECGQFGGSLIAHQPRRVRSRVFHQVAGLLCLVGAEDVLRRHIGDALAAGIVEPAADWGTLLLQASQAQRFTVDWSFGGSGPDHERVFVATCRAGSRRQTTGEGTSKKAARLSAAETMIREHFPEVAQKASSGHRPPHAPSSVPFSRNRDFQRTVDSITTAFGIGSDASPLIAQAFIHSSWAYENGQEMFRSRQRDHGVLGFIGSHVLDYEASLAETAEVVSTCAAEYAHRVVETSVHLEASHLLGLDRAMLLGRGQQQQGVSGELGSNTFQAMVAAVYLASGVPGSVIENWPGGGAWDAVSELIAPGSGRGVDVTTRIQEFASACGLVTQHEFDREGPDHRSEFTARLVLDSPSLRRRVTVKGTPQPGKTPAKHAASAIVVRWIDALADPDQVRSIAGGGESALAGTTFLLAHLCEEASTRPAVTTTWVRRALFGSTLTGTALERWAAAVDQLLLRQKGIEPDDDALTTYFRRTSGARDSVVPLSELLESTLEWVVAIDPEEPIDERAERRLVDLAAAYRALGGDQQAIPFGEAVEGQMLLSRGMLTSDAQSVPGEVPALVFAAIESVLSAMLADRRRVHLSISESGRVALQGELSESAPALQLAQSAEIWRELGVALDIDDDAGTVSLESGATVEAAGPVATAVRLGSAPESSPLASAVADLLHDLKNQIAAAKVLSAKPSDGSRTSVLERQLAASRHLDQAEALAERIRAASSLLRRASDETTPLSTFVRRYASAMLVRVPTSVALQVGSGTDEIAVGMSEAGLTAVLDNLIKNAVEAMPDGGRVTLDWANDHNAAVVEIADDGPGLPESVRTALVSGGRIGSTKPGGNGLGLLGVQSMLRRVGGSLELVASSRGTVWHLTIPLAEDGLS